MWQDLSIQWQKAFELAWQSYKRNTIPIGAVICNADGHIIAEGRNRIFDELSSNPLAGTYMAHAEMTSMIQLKEKEHPDIRSYTLYTTMEPCPMCFGTMLMMHLGQMVYAAQDRFAGATDLKDKIDYFRKVASPRYELCSYFGRFRESILDITITFQNRYSNKYDFPMKQGIRRWSLPMKVVKWKSSN